MKVLTLDQNNVVICIKHLKQGYVLKENEIENEFGELGQILQEDGTFIDPEQQEPPQEPSLEDKINFIYYKQMGVI